MGMKLLLDEMLEAVDVIEVSSIFPHEQTIASNVKRLKEAMLNIGQLVDPIITDRKSGVVLDGNHRLKVLQTIECPLAVCQQVNYADPSITVGTWLPVTEHPLDSIIKNKKIRSEQVDPKDAWKIVGKSSAPFVAVAKKKGASIASEAYILNSDTYSLRELINEQHYVLSCLDDVQFEYIPDTQADEYLSNGYTVFLRRPFTKDEIIKTAKASLPFPPKSTRHMIPNRIIRLNMRLGWLHEGKEEARRLLREMLSKRVYDGNVRRYSEPVIVIY